MKKQQIAINRLFHLYGRSIWSLVWYMFRKFNRSYVETDKHIRLKLKIKFKKIFSMISISIKLLIYLVKLELVNTFLLANYSKQWY
jgi:hypothetical protein